MQLYIEKWLQIIQRLTLIEPPKPGGRLLQSLDDMFTELQRPFVQYKAGKRKNFLNYNYVFCRLFQKVGCPQFSMFFPLIKSRQKLKALDEMWEGMVSSVGWEVKPLQIVAPFAVKLEQPDRLLQQIRQRVASGVPAETHTMPSRKVFRKSDLLLLRELDRQTLLRQRRSAPPELELQRLGSSVKRPRSGVAKELQSRLLKRHRR